MHIITVKPGEEENARASAELQRLFKEILDIEGLSNKSICRICGLQPANSLEHVPSKSAGNRGRIVEGRIDDRKSIESGNLSWTFETVQRSVISSLCRGCNNNSGLNYNPSYVKFKKHFESLAKAENAGRVCQVKLRMHPQRVIKQALFSLLAVSQPGVTTKYPSLRDALIEREKAFQMAPYRLWFFLTAAQGGRSTGLTARAAPGKRGQIWAEWSFWPLGWLFSLDDAPVPGAVDVSSWSMVPFVEEREIELSVPCQWAITAYPGDFKIPEEIARLLNLKPE